jgi:hypothetical protein
MSNVSSTARPQIINADDFVAFPEEAITQV